MFTFQELADAVSTSHWLSNIYSSRLVDLTRFNKIAIQATAQMAADKEAYQESTCTFLSVSCSYETRSADNLFQSFTVLWENEYLNPPYSALSLV